MSCFALEIAKGLYKDFADEEQNVSCLGFKICVELSGQILIQKLVIISCFPIH